MGKEKKERERKLKESELGTFRSIRSNKSFGPFNQDAAINEELKNDKINDGESGGGLTLM